MTDTSDSTPIDASAAQLRDRFDMATSPAAALHLAIETIPVPGLALSIDGPSTIMKVVEVLNENGWALVPQAQIDALQAGADGNSRIINLNARSAALAHAVNYAVGVKEGAVIDPLTVAPDFAAFISATGLPPTAAELAEYLTTSCGAYRGSPSDAITDAKGFLDR